MHLSKAATETYRHAIRVTLGDLLDMDAGSLSGADVYRWTGESAKHGSNRTVNKALTALSSAYQRGVEWGIVESNPVRGIRRLPETRGLPNIPTPADLEHLLSTAPSEQAHLLIRVASKTGLRQGELFALEWPNVHDAHLTIAQALDRDQTMKVTKTGKPRRVPIPPRLAAELELHRPASRRGLVFANASGKPLSRTNFVRRTWHPWRRHAAWQAAAAGDDWHRLIDLRWMHLRHYYASRLASIGVTLLSTSRWMGHGTIRTTMDRYGFLFEDDEASAMHLLDADE
jgi:integrase